MTITTSLVRTMHCALAGTITMLLSSSVLGQTAADILAELAECSHIEVDRARLNCFDGVFASLPDQLAPAAPQPAPAEPPAAVSPAPASASSVPAAAPQQRSRSMLMPNPELTRIVTVVELYELARGNMRFVTSDGEIYTQPIGERPGRYPDVPFEAELESGAMGSYFIEPLERGPRTRVSLMK